MIDSKESKNISRLKITPIVIPRSQHIISRMQINDNALKVLYRLKNAKYKAYLVGGAVRDILLGRRPKDFDVVTDAKPEQIRELFRNCRLIGRRFRLAHIQFGKEIIEVSTFRAPHHISDKNEGQAKDGRIIRDNVYGDIDDDVWRRDFTINSLFYNIEDFSVVDYVGGIKDLEIGQLRLIGDPVKRYIEDPVRILRAIRFASKLNLKIHSDTEKPIKDYSNLLENIPSARLYEEILKLFLNGHAVETFILLRKYNLFKYLFPQMDQLLNETQKNYSYEFIMRALNNTDQRINEGDSATPGFLLAAMLWEPVRILSSEYISNNLSEVEAAKLAGDTIISKQISSTSIPRRYTHMARDIWTLQARLKRTKKKSLRVLMHPKFRAAYDFLLLRAQSGERLENLVDYWTKEQLDEPLAGKDKPRKLGNRSNSSYRRTRNSRKKDL
tara:strand:- start:406 stop:1731 length:1326 start_codon:yes stop_codon:yes gene_type:complete